LMTHRQMRAFWAKPAGLSMRGDSGASRGLPERHPVLP
jgi:hypothetical protein